MPEGLREPRQPIKAHTHFLVREGDWTVADTEFNTEAEQMACLGKLTIELCNILLLKKLKHGIGGS